MRKYVIALACALLGYAYPMDRSPQIQGEFLARAEPVLEWLDLAVNFSDSGRAREVGKAYQLVRARMHPR